MLLNVDGLTAGYGNLMVLRDITFSVNQGETVGVIGANGAGKTTLLWALSGIIRPAAGKITFQGRDITGWRSPHILRLGVGHVLEGMHVFSTMSVEDNLRLGAFGQGSGLHKPQDDKLAIVYKYFPVLENRRKQTAGSLSGGEKQMLAIGRTLMCDLKLLLLDEPSAGLAPLLVKRVFEILRDLREHLSLTILLVEQNANLALKFADRGLVLGQGRIRLQGEAKDLANNKEVRRIYLGEATA